MLHYGLMTLIILIVMIGISIKLNKYRRFIRSLTVVYVVSFVGLMVSIGSGHDYAIPSKDYDYIMIFGGGLLRDYSLPETVVNRLDQGLAAGQGRSVTYIVSGGYGEGERPSEAAVMADYLMTNGVQATHIILEEASMSTWDNLMFTKKALALRHIEKSSILGVSSDYHMRRIAMLFKRASFDMDLLPAKTPVWECLDHYPREYYASVKSLLFDRNLSVAESIAIERSIDNVQAMAPMQVAMYDGFDHDHHVAEVSLATVGDIMVHRSQLKRAYDGESFDFGPSFQWIGPVIRDADYAIGNLETTLAGYNGQRRLNVDMFFQGYSGYPVFNSPDVLADNLKEAGFDLMLTANNHTLDSKEAGVIRTLDVLDAHGLDHIGSYSNEQASEAPFIKEIEGISFGIVNYTYAMNGFWLSEDQDYMINHLGNYDDGKINQMYEEVEALAKSDVDFVLATIHYGIEYLNEPDQRIQQPLIDGLFASGADVILASHPHVLQPFEVRSITRADGQVERGVVIYSLGNFISSQKHRFTGEDTDVGMVFKLDFKKLDQEKATIESLSYAPTYVYWSHEDLMVIPIYDIPDAIELGWEDQKRIDYAKTEIVPLVNSYHQGDYVMDGPYLTFDLKPLKDYNKVKPETTKAD